jgi:hypothetical protein
MLLTSLTTAVAFFGTAICPVGPIACFAIFCGLLIIFDYVMNIFLVFPSLCMYDKWLMAGSKNSCVSFDWCCCEGSSSSDILARPAPKPGDGAAGDVEQSLSLEGGAEIEEIARTSDSEEIIASVRDGMKRSTTLEGGAEIEESAQTSDEFIEKNDLNETEREELLEVEHQTLIHRILDGYYNILHRFRWLLLAVVIAGFITAAIFAAQMTLPESSEVILLPDNNEYEMHWAWRQDLLSTKLAKEAGSLALITWGVTPADTGDHLNPASWTTLVLDDAFDPKSEDAQSYLLDFCARLFAEFGNVEEDYQCPMNVSKPHHLLH